MAAAAVDRDENVIGEDSDDDDEKAEMRLTEREKRAAMEELRMYRPVSRLTPIFYQQWLNRFPNGKPCPRSDASLERVLQKAHTYIADRAHRWIFLGNNRDVIVMAMRMVIMHEERGFPLRALEDELIVPMLGTKPTIIFHVFVGPHFNPFKTIDFFEYQFPQMYDHPSAFNVDMRRVAVAATEAEMELEFLKTDAGGHQHVFHSRILAVFSGIFTIVYEGRKIYMCDNIARDGAVSIHLSWTREHNMAVVRAVEPGLARRPMRMSAEYIEEMDENIA